VIQGSTCPYMESCVSESFQNRRNGGLKQRKSLTARIKFMNTWLSWGIKVSFVIIVDPRYFWWHREMSFSFSILGLYHLYSVEYSNTFHTIYMIEERMSMLNMSIVIVEERDFILGRCWDSNWSFVIVPNNCSYLWTIFSLLICILSWTDVFVCYICICTWIYITNYHVLVPN